MSQILYMEIVSFSIHNIVYFPPCLDRKDGEAGLKKPVCVQPDNWDIV